MKDPFAYESAREIVSKDVLPNGPKKNGFDPIYLTGPVQSEADLEWRTDLGDEHDDIWWYDPVVEFGHPVTGHEHDELVVYDHQDVIEKSAAMLVGWDDLEHSEQVLTEMMFAHHGWTPIVVWTRNAPKLTPWVKYHAVFVSDVQAECVEFIREVVIGDE